MKIFENIFNIRLILLFAYIAVNLTMHFFSIENASYIHGADAARYLQPALSLASGNGIIDISSTGPLYPIYLAIHIFIFGEQNYVTALIFSQSLVLFLTGLFASYLSRNLGLSVLPIIVLIFVIVNPNSIMIAHLVQTETLFTFFLTLYFFYLQKYFKTHHFKNLITLSILATLISLTRPAGMYVMLFFGVVSIFSVFDGNSLNRWFKDNLIYILILAIGLGLNALYNNKVHKEYFISANQGFVFYDQYIGLLQYGYGLSAEDAHKKSKAILSDKISPELKTCVNNLTEIRCKDEISSIFIKEIVNSKPSALLKGFSTSVSSLLFSGGASNFVNYFGFEAKKQVISFEKSEGGMFNIKKIIKFISSINLTYFSALIVFWGWAVTTKIFMLIGFYLEFSKANKLFYLGMLIVLLLFIAEYLFLGQSRWRAPLDPIFMMFAAVGYSILINKFFIFLKKNKEQNF